MRKIKFRAWDKENGDMFMEKFVDVLGVGSEMRVYKSNSHTLHCNGGIPEIFFHAPFEIMQYTGLKDKNNKEIYEGDIVKFYDGNINKEIVREVYYDTELTEFGVKMSFKLFHKQFEKDFEKVGNKYENPELLEE